VLVRASAVTSPEGPLFCAAARGPNRPVPRKSRNIVGLCQVRRLRCYAPCWGFSRNCGARARRRSRFRRPWPVDATRSRSHCTPVMCARWDAYAVTSPEGPLFRAPASLAVIRTWRNARRGTYAELPYAPSPPRVVPRRHREMERTGKLKDSLGYEPTDCAVQGRF